MINKFMFYIYAYIDPRTNLPFYIGKGKDDRKFDHLNENSSKKENKEKYKIIAELKSLGIAPIIKELESNISNELLAYNREDFYILSYGRKGIDPNGILTNKTIGGKCPPKPVWDKSRKDQHRNFNKTFWTTEQREQHSKNNPAKGITHARDQNGKVCRISVDEYRSMPKSEDQTTWQYAQVNSKEGKRRKALIEHP